MTRVLLLLLALLALTIILVSAFGDTREACEKRGGTWTRYECVEETPRDR